MGGYTSLGGGLEIKLKGGGLSEGPIKIMLVQPDVKYEHTIAHENDVGDLLEVGWEPVPDVLPVISHALATPSTYVFLRKRKP